MISKIAGHNDFHKITQAKASKSFFDKSVEASKKVLETKNSSNAGDAPQQSPYDAFLAQQALSEIKKAQLFKKK